MSPKKLKTVILAVMFINTLLISAQNNKQNTNSPNKDVRIVEETVGVKPDRGSIVESLYKEAVAWLKTPYRYGGNSRKGIDCSAFTNTIYANVFGVKLNRSSKDISARDVKELKRNELKPGDLVFFATSRKRKGVSHVGVYLGNDYFVHASTRKGVTISSLNEPYYNRTFVKGGEVKNVDKALFANIDIELQPEDLQMNSVYVEAKESAVPTTISTEILLKQMPKTIISE